MKNSISLLLGVVVVLTVCPPSQASAKREPKVNLDGCVAAVHAWGLTLKHDIASFMGLKTPSRWIRPENYVNELKSLNGGKQVVRLSEK